MEFTIINVGKMPRRCSVPGCGHVATKVIVGSRPDFALCDKCAASLKKMFGGLKKEFAKQSAKNEVNAKNEDN